MKPAQAASADVLGNGSVRLPGPALSRVPAIASGSLGRGVVATAVVGSRIDQALVRRAQTVPDLLQTPSSKVGDEVRRSLVDIFDHSLPAPPTPARSQRSSHTAETLGTRHGVGGRHTLTQSTPASRRPLLGLFEVACAARRHGRPAAACDAAFNVLRRKGCAKVCEA